MSQPLQGQIPWLDLSKPKSHEKVLQEYGAADFRQVVQTNIEKSFIEKQAALLSVSNLVSPFIDVKSLNAVIEASVNGGVTVQYPIDGTVGETGRDTSNGPLVPKLVRLSKANITYRISHEAMMEGNDLAENDSITEGYEVLGGKMDAEFLTELSAKKDPDNAVDGTNWNGSAGDPYGDINKATNNILVNSAINPNTKKDGWFTVIAPLEYRATLEVMTMIDGLKTSLTELIKKELKVDIVYSRPPFRYEGVWPLVNKAIVVPTQDRHVGRFYRYSGGNALPSMFVTVNEDGKRVSTNTWMKYAVAPAEKDGDLTKNNRIAEIGSINA